MPPSTHCGIVGGGGGASFPVCKYITAWWGRGLTAPACKHGMAREGGAHCPACKCDAAWWGRGEASLPSVQVWRGQGRGRASSSNAHSMASEEGVALLHCLHSTGKGAEPHCGLSQPTGRCLATQAGGCLGGAKPPLDFFKGGLSSPASPYLMRLPYIY